MTDYVIEFERIGRRRDLEPLHVSAADADDLAAQVFRHADRYLGSREFTVLVDLEQGTVSIGAGRFGRGSVVAA